MMDYSSKDYVPSNSKKKLKEKLKKEISNIKKELKKGYSTDYASINLPSDKKIVQNCIDLAKKYKKRKVIVVGIGGSNLGTIAVHDAIFGKFENKIYFADTVDTNLIKELKLKTKKEKVVINLISKSGKTTETIANFLALNMKAPVVITTNKNSPLWHYGEVNGHDLLEIPERVGGRFSVLSPVGLFPLAVAGVDVKELLKGAKVSVENNLKITSDVVDSAIGLFYHYKKGKNIAETFVFSPEFESLGKWYRQLMGESTGKQFSKNKKLVWNGMTPTVAVGSTDLHSMAQLYLGGPKDKFVMFLLPRYSDSVKISKSALRVVPFIQGKTLKEVMDAIIIGIKKAFEKQKRPFNSIEIKVRSEKDIGSWLQFKMLEIIYLSYFMNVNPFDQPNVEEYKIITKEVLK